MMYKIILFIFILFAIKNFALGQNSSLSEKLAEKYPNAKAICLKKSKTLHLTYLKDSLVCKADYYTENLHLSSQSSNYANESVSFSQFHEINFIKAYTILPNKKQMVVKDFTTKSILANHVFFDDLKEKTFIFPAISAGAKTILEYQETIKEPRLLGIYYLNSYLPVEKSEFIVKCSPEIKINYKVFGENQQKIKFKTYKLNNEIIYQWTSENLASMKNEENIAKSENDEPHIIVYIEEILANSLLPKSTINQKNKINSSQKTNTRYLKNLDDLYYWYYGLTKNVLKNTNTYIKNLADSLTKNSKTDLEKATILYNWVQKNIRYIAFEDGLGGLIPRNPHEVCRKRYGDCKDMATLLFSLANAINLECHLVWVGTRAIPYRYDDLPLPIVDNHLVTAFNFKKNQNIDNQSIIKKKQYIFADATADNLAFGVPSDFIQGKQALLGIDSNSYELVEIPITKAENNVYYDSLHLKIDSNKISGKGKLYLNGYPIIKGMKTYNDISLSNRKTLVDKKNNQLIVSNINLIENNLHNKINNNINNITKNIEFTYDCEAKNLVKYSGTDMFINFHLDKKLMTEKIDTTRRQTAIAIEFPYKYIFESILEIPEHWQTNYVPENRSFEHERFSFHINYRQLGTKIIMRKEIIIRCLAIEKSDFLSWNIMIEELNKAYQETVSLYE